MSVFKGKASNQSYSGETVPAGNHPAVLVALIDLGTHSEAYQGVSKELHKVYLVWELTSEKCTETGKNYFIGRDFTLSLNAKAGLRKFVEGWRGKAFNDGEEFDYGVLLGKSCLLSVIHTEKGYAKADSASAVPRGMTVPPATVKPISYEITDARNAPPADEWLPYIYGFSVTEQVKSSAEWLGQLSKKAEAQPVGVPSGAPNDEIPF